MSSSLNRHRPQTGVDSGWHWTSRASVLGNATFRCSCHSPFRTDPLPEQLRGSSSAESKADQLPRGPSMELHPFVVSEQRIKAASECKAVCRIVLVEGFTEGCCNSELGRALRGVVQSAGFGFAGEVVHARAYRQLRGNTLGSQRRRARHHGLGRALAC